MGSLLLAPDPGLRRGVASLSHSCVVAAWHSRPLPLTSYVVYLLLAAALQAWGPLGFCLDLKRGVAPLGRAMCTGHAILNINPL